MRAVSIALPGIRLLNQDPWECLISFIFSSNNNIKRITKGLDLLRSRYGEYLCSVSKTVQPEGGVGTSYWCVQLPPIATRCDETSVSKKRKLESMTSSSTCDELEHKQSPLLAEATNEIFNLYSFPSVEALSNLSEQVFRDMG